MEIDTRWIISPVHIRSYQNAEIKIDKLKTQNQFLQAAGEPSR